jgi:hypothetical protein
MNATIPVYRWSFRKLSEQPGETLAILTRDGVLASQIVVSEEPAIHGFRSRACEWRLIEGDLVVRAGLADTLPAAVYALDRERLAWERLTEEQRETAMGNARGRTTR